MLFNSDWVPASFQTFSSCNILESMHCFVLSWNHYLQLERVFLLPVWQFGKERGRVGDCGLGRCRRETFREGCFGCVKWSSRSKAGWRSGRCWRFVRKWSWLKHLKKDNSSCVNEQFNRKRLKYITNSKISLVILFSKMLPLNKAMFIGSAVVFSIVDMKASSHPDSKLFLCVHTHTNLKSRL